MKNFDLDNLERKNIYKVPESIFENIQEKVLLSGVKDFDLDNLERINIYKTPDHLFENIQERVLSGVKDFDLENLQRKNIYKVPEMMFETVQERVVSKVNTEKKVPIFKMNWGYAVAASVALIFGVTFVYNLNSDSSLDANSLKKYAGSTEVQKKESQLAYETLKSDLTSAENSDQKIENQKNVKTLVSQTVNNNSEKQGKRTVKSADEIHMNEYIEALTSSEIAELANNSSQDVYLDLYN